MSPMPAHAAFLTGSMATPPIDEFVVADVDNVLQGLRSSGSVTRQQSAA